MFEYVREYLKINDVEYKENFKLRNISPIKIGGNAKIVAYPDTEEKIVSLTSFCTKIGSKYKILGRMSNVLPPDNEYCGVIVRTDRLSLVRFDNESISAEAGASLPHIASLAADCGIGGFEELSGIPGSVAGAVVGNAGAFGREISDVLVSVKCYFPDEGILQNFTSKNMDFAYRHSIIKNKNCLVLSCVFEGKTSSVDEVKSRLATFRDERNKRQPTDKPSLGSTFKRPCDGVSAGALIDACGLKGFSVGGAAISTKHAGVIVNLGGASAADYIEVAEKAQGEVYRRFQVNLEKEIEIFN